MLWVLFPKPTDVLWVICAVPKTEDLRSQNPQQTLRYKRRRMGVFELQGKTHCLDEHFIETGAQGDPQLLNVWIFWQLFGTLKYQLPESKYSGRNSLFFQKIVFTPRIYSAKNFPHVNLRSSGKKTPSLPFSSTSSFTAWTGTLSCFESWTSLWFELVFNQKAIKVGFGGMKPNKKEQGTYCA